MIVDAHNHFAIGSHVRKEHYDSKGIRNRIKEMDEAGVDKQLLSNLIYGPGRQSARVARRFNVNLSKTVKDYHDRFIGLACIPMSDGRAALAELENSASTLELDGLFIRPYQGRLDYKELWPFFAKAADIGLPIFTHPVKPFIKNVFNSYDLAQILWYMFDTTLASTRAIFSGLLEDFPKLKIVFAHIGGTLPYLIGRVDAAWNIAKIDPDLPTRIPKRPLEYFKMLYFDTVSYHEDALMCAYKTAGADKLLFGTDYPFKSLGNVTEHIELIRSLKIPEADKRKILGENVTRLLKG